MNRQVSISILLIAIASLTAGCIRETSSGDKTKSEKLTLTGSSTLAPLVSEIAGKFEKENSGVRVEVQTGGSSRGIRDVGAGTADIGMASRALKAGESKGMVTSTIAWDGVAFVVHSKNPVKSLTRDQLIGIYKGRINNWRAVGGKDAPIIVSNRAEGRSELDLVADYFQMKTTEFEADVVDGETQQSIKTVANNENAIVYTSIGAARISISEGIPLKLLPLDGVSATAENVQAGLYPLARPLILICPEAGDSISKSLTEKFIEFSLSSEQDDVTTGLGYVPPARVPDESE